MSQLGTELAAGQWTFAVWARGMLGAPALRELMRSAGRPDVAALTLRIYMMLNEAGVGLRGDGDAVRFVLGGRTAFASPDEVVSKLLAISAVDVIDGSSTARLRQIADATPGSSLAADLDAGPAGLKVIGRLIDAFSIVAIPTFMTPTKR